MYYSGINKCNWGRVEGWEGFFSFSFHMLYAIPNLPNAAEEENLDHGLGLDGSAYSSQIKSHLSNSLVSTARMLLTLAIILSLDVGSCAVLYRNR